MNRCQEPFEGNGFHQVVYHIQRISFQCIFRIGSSEDHHGRIVKCFEKLDTGNFRHADIQKNQIDDALPQIRSGLHGIFTFGNQMQKFNFLHVLLHSLPGYGFVVDDETVEGHFASVVSRRSRGFTPIPHPNPLLKERERFKYTSSLLLQEKG